MPPGSLLPHAIELQRNFSQTSSPTRRYVSLASAHEALKVLLRLLGHQRALVQILVLVDAAAAGDGRGAVHASGIELVARLRFANVDVESRHAVADAPEVLEAVCEEEQSVADWGLEAG